MKFLDNNGLLYLWQKIKAKINSSGLLNESVIGWNGGEIPEGYEEIEIEKNESDGILTGSIIEWEEEEIPEGYEEVENSGGGGADISTIVDMLYPIGRGFLDFTDTDYSNWLGLTWERELVGMFPVGYNPNDTSFDSIGEKGGEKTHTLTTNEMPAHSHASYVTGYSGWGTMTISGYVHKFANLANQSSGTTSLANTSISTMTLGTGGSQPHNNLPPYQVVSYWKRVA